MCITQKMEGGGKIKKTRPRKKPYARKQKDIISPDNNTSTPGNISEVTARATTSDEKANEEENPLVKIIRYVHYTLFESAVYCDRCKHQFGDIAAGLVSDQTLEMYKKHVNQGVQEGICHKYDCFVGNTLRFILYYFPATCKDVAYAKYGNEMSEKEDLLLDTMRDCVLSYRNCAHPFVDSKHYSQKVCKIILDAILTKYYEPMLV